MSVIERTVRNDLTIRLNGCDFEPKDKHSEWLMRSWINKRVQVAEYNYWGTEAVAAIRLQALDVSHQAYLTMAPVEQNQGDEP